MLVLAFALATDYEVFVIARIKEAHDQGWPDREAIALGIERTGRIITAAALLFCVAIGALAISDLFFTNNSASAPRSPSRSTQASSERSSSHP